MEKNGSRLLDKKVSERLENLSSDDKIIGLYDAEIEEEKIKKTMIDNAREEGIKDGIIKTAKNMLKEGSTLEFISKVTQLSIQEINDLK